VHTPAVFAYLPNAAIPVIIAFQAEWARPRSLNLVLRISFVPVQDTASTGVYIRVFLPDLNVNLSLSRPSALSTTMEAQGSFYSPAEDPECTLCHDSDDHHTIFAVTHYKDWTKTLAPYSVVTDVDDLLKDVSESPADLGRRAYVWQTFDSPYVPIGKMNSKLPQSRAPASTVAAGMAKKGPRPVIIFPGTRPEDEQGCVMATFDGGKINLDQSFTDFFAGGVWPTLASGSNGCVTHPHHTHVGESPRLFPGCRLRR
jgi:hypothetical protein